MTRGDEVRAAVSLYRSLLAAHIDHQGGRVSAMAINQGILVCFVPCNDKQVHICYKQFKEDVKFVINWYQIWLKEPALFFREYARYKRTRKLNGHLAGW